MTAAPAVPVPLPAAAGHGRDIALFLDVDGTIAEIAPRPDLVTVPGALRPTLATLQSALGGAVALVSGRTVADVEALLPWADVAVAGAHGLETRRPGERAARVPAAAGFAPLVAALRAFCDARPGLILEDKSVCAAVHYRQRPDLGGAVRETVARLLGERPGFVSLEGKAVVEIKPAGTDKGSAIRGFMAEAPFAGREPVFVGDDTTDEPGFAAVRALGGMAVRVGDARPTRAAYRLPDVGAVLAWLRGLAASFGDG